MSKIYTITKSLLQDAIPDINPGAGVLCVKLIGNKEGLSCKFIIESINRCTPVNTSHGRRSAFITGNRLEIVYATIRLEVGHMYEFIQTHISKDVKKQTVNSLYMTRWCEKYNINKEELLADLGVWKQNTKLSVGISRQNGVYLFVDTNRQDYYTAFTEYWNAEDIHKEHQSSLIEMLIDVAIFTALNRIDRMILYRQVVSSLCLPISDRRKSDKDITIYETILSGICYETCELRDGISCYGGDGRTLVKGEIDGEWIVTGGKRRKDSNLIKEQMNVNLVLGSLVATIV